ERVEELERRLGLNSTNSGKPPSSRELKRERRVKSLRELAEITNCAVRPHCQGMPTTTSPMTSPTRVRGNPRREPPGRARITPSSESAAAAKPPYAAHVRIVKAGRNSHHRKR